MEPELERVIMFTLLICGAFGLLLILLMLISIIPSTDMLESISVVLVILGVAGALLAPVVAERTHKPFKVRLQERRLQIKVDYHKFKREFLRAFGHSKDPKVREESTIKQFWDLYIFGTTKPVSLEQFFAETAKKLFPDEDMYH